MTTPLITRLEKAAEGSRDLDARVASVFSHDVESDDGDFWWGPFNEQAERVPDFTTSIDAALALAERVLPEMNCTGFDKTPLGVETYVSLNNVNSGHWCEIGWHKSSPAIALCIAILKANHKDKP